MDVWYKCKKYVEEGDCDYNDDWDRPNTTTTYSLGETVYIKEPSPSWGYEKDSIPDETLKEGDIVYLVYVVYSTGDSFGHDDGWGFEVVGWYKDRGHAEKAMKAVKNGPTKFEHKGRNGLEPNTVYVPTYDGKDKRSQYCGSWLGYFESLDYVEIQEMIVSD